MLKKTYRSGMLGRAFEPMRGQVTGAIENFIISMICSLHAIFL
jgi:hypothetical protein